MASIARVLPRKDRHLALETFLWLHGNQWCLEAGQEKNLWEGEERKLLRERSKGQGERRVAKNKRWRTCEALLQSSSKAYGSPLP